MFASPSRFVLSPDDPNYDNYVSDMDDSAGQPLFYYRTQAHNLREDEKGTLSVDFQHMASFQWQDPAFMDNLMQDYGRYEVYLRRAVFQFLNGTGYAIQKNKYF